MRESPATLSSHVRTTQMSPLLPSKYRTHGTPRGSMCPAQFVPRPTTARSGLESTWQLFRLCTSDGRSPAKLARDVVGQRAHTGNRSCKSGCQHSAADGTWERLSTPHSLADQRFDEFRAAEGAAARKDAVKRLAGGLVGAKTGSETCGCNCNAHYTVPVEQVCCTAGVTACPFPGCTWKRQAPWASGAHQKKKKGSSRSAYVNASARISTRYVTLCPAHVAWLRFSAPQTHLSPVRPLVF